MVVLSLLGGTAAAQSPGKDELQKRFEQRYARLVQLKQAGEIGETWRGYVAAVDRASEGRESVRTMLEEENRDRKLLYAILAEELKAHLEEPSRAMMTPQVVAERNAVRNFEKAKESEPVCVAEGAWTTRKDRPWLLRLLELESKGQVGETSAGYVDAVRPEHGRNTEVKRIIDQENAARRERYEKLAQQQGVTVESVSREEARRYAKWAHRGVLVQNADGAWEKKK
jgi:uncharacterized protein YdbL (DUF1318 family)